MWLKGGRGVFEVGLVRMEQGREEGQGGRDGREARQKKGQHLPV